MKEQFVTYRIAMKLKELGFDEITFTYFKEDCTLEEDIICINGSKFWNLPNIKEIAAPLWQQVIDWFEEKYNLHIKFDLIGHSKIMHTFKIYSTGDIFLPRKEENTTSYFGECYESFKEAREQAILKVLELIK